MSKYIKYKNKYIFLKNKNSILNDTTLSMSIVGGGEKYTKNLKKFIDWYNTQQQSKSSVDILQILYKFHQFDDLKIFSIPRNILVGCSNKDDNDYFRFKDNNFYSLYINSSNEFAFDSVRQYYMYTIYKEQLLEQINNENYKGNKIKYKLENLPPNTIDNIHFDLYTSYLCNSQEYFRIASHLLKPYGIMSFNLYGNTSGAIYTYNQTTKIFKSNFGRESDPEVSLQELQDRYKVIIDVEKNEIRLAKSAYLSNMLSPQSYLTINNSVKGSRFEFISNYDEYIEYLRTIYNGKFTFEKVMYTLKNYTYPVPIRIDNTNQILLYDESKSLIIFNIIMTSDERQGYLKDKIISEDLINELAERILENAEYLQHFSEDNTITLTKENIVDKINSILSKPQYYINVTKI